MKANLEKLTRESEEKEASINLQEENITNLTKKLEKRCAQSSINDLEPKNSRKLSIDTEASDHEKQLKKSATLKMSSPLDP